MFFIGVFGIEQKEETKKEYTNIVCSVCGRWTHAKLVYAYSYFHFFFLPLFRYHKRYLVELGCCGALYEANVEYYQELLAGAALDFSRLIRSGQSGTAGGEAKFCPRCGAKSDPSFEYCPFCGTKLS